MEKYSLLIGFGVTGVIFIILLLTLKKKRITKTIKIKYTHCVANRKRENNVLVELSNQYSIGFREDAHFITDEGEKFALFITNNGSDPEPIDEVIINQIKFKKNEFVSVDATFVESKSLFDKEYKPDTIIIPSLNISTKYFK